MTLFDANDPSDETVYNDHAESVAVGRAFENRCVEVLTEKWQWTLTGRHVRHSCGVELDLTALDDNRRLVGIECKGGARDRPALQRGDILQRVVGCATFIHRSERHRPEAERIRYLVLTSALPTPKNSWSDSYWHVIADGLLTVVLIT